MIFFLLWLSIRFIHSYHILNPSDLSCKKHDYRLITDQSNYIVTLKNSLTTIDAALGFDSKHISPLLTELWYEQVHQQPLILQSYGQQEKVYGRFNKHDNNSWSFKLSSIINPSGMRSTDDSSFDSNVILHIQSTLFNKRVDLLVRANEKDPCSFPRSADDFTRCCGLCIIMNPCSEVKTLSEHSRHDLMVTDHGLIVSRSFQRAHEDFRCLLFPSDQTKRFWSTITNAMNIGQLPDKNDLIVLQHTYGTIQKLFYYSLYPFHKWNKQMMDFDFFDVIFIPYKQLAIFELNECNKTSCKLLLHLYKYQLNKTIQLSHHLYLPEITIENNVSSTGYFRLYFNMLSNSLYLIGKQNIYASDDYGVELTRIWTSDSIVSDPIILNPIMFSDTGHIAFIYQLNDSSSCCRYFAVFSKTGMYYGWRTQIFRSSVPLVEPFFFDFSGSLYFNASPPLLVIQATEQSLVATHQLLVNHIRNPFFVQETDMNRVFVFCSLSVWDNRFELIGSTLQFDQLGSFFIISIDRSSSHFGFCLQTSRLTYGSNQTSRHCSLTTGSSQTTEQIHLHLSGCSFIDADQNSTIVVTKFPTIFIEKIINNTMAIGRIFQNATANDIHVDQWNLINVHNVEQVLDRCLLQNLDQNYHHPLFIHIPPGTIYLLANGDQLVRKNFYFLFQNDYSFHEDQTTDNLFVIASLFNNRKSIIHHEFIRTQLSCYLPSIRTITFQTKCISNTLIQPKFEINSDLPKLYSIAPPVDFQLNRYQAGFNSVIVYNLDQDKNSICDGFKNCSCISSIFSHLPILYCAKQIYTIDATVNNLVYMNLWMENEVLHLLNQQSIFLIEEVSKRHDYELLQNLWTKEKKEEILDLFLKNFSQLTENEIDIFELMNTSLSDGKYLFLGPNLKLKLMDEGLYHFRLTYLWGDQYCLSSIDLLILMISNTPTITSYMFNYFFGCILILIFILIFWIGYVMFYERIFKKYCKSLFLRKRKETFFHRRSIDDHMNFEMLVKIREQSQRLLPYQQLSPKVENDEERIERLHDKQSYRLNTFSSDQYKYKPNDQSNSSSIFNHYIPN